MVKPPEAVFLFAFTSQLEYPQLKTDRELSNNHEHKVPISKNGPEHF